ncbi:site-2 protease family protein [Streptomyces sp. NPDC004610]|uniref:site-2 protease family protein n=1 Tax=unclassified Streptomyces TaxID=2593676 RepID=UPI00339FF5B8
MDESGGSRQPRLEHDEPTESPTAPTATPEDGAATGPSQGSKDPEGPGDTPETEKAPPIRSVPDAGDDAGEAADPGGTADAGDDDKGAEGTETPTDASGTSGTSGPSGSSGSSGSSGTPEPSDPSVRARTPESPRTPETAKTAQAAEPPKPPQSSEVPQSSEAPEPSEAPTAPSEAPTASEPSGAPDTPRTPNLSKPPHTPQSPHTPQAPHTPPTPHDSHPDRAHAHAHPPTPQDSRPGEVTSPPSARPPRRPREPGGGLLMGRPFGVPVYVAPSWFVVAALITWVFGGQLDRVLPELGGARYLVALFFAVAFYASVLVHELAHTVAALRFKLPVRRIQLQFFGGVSEIEKEAETPGREFVLAFVGPLLSLVLGGVFYLAMQLVEPGTVPGVLLAGLMISNLIVAAFNLLPGLPLDGGRMLRAVVWKLTGRPMSGTVAAAWVGRALAVSVLIGLPLLTQSGVLGTSAADNVGMDTVMDALLAAILAAIIWTGAGNSLRVARLREHLPELQARTLTRRAVPVESDTPLSEALRRANTAGARALVVVDGDGSPVSLVREAAIVGVPEHRRPWVPVSGLAQDLTDGMRVSAELAGEDLLEVLRATPATEYLVIEETGAIYGVLSAADVERAFVKAMARPS